MVNWRERILREFTPQVARLTLVADPDGLLLEEGVLQGIRERGFELIPFDDHVAFRFAYESRFREQWDRGGRTDLVVLLRSDSAVLDTLPYDLLKAGRRLSFSIGELFPDLSPPVLAVLDRADLDAVAAALAHKTIPGSLGDNATKDFILRHVFQLASDFIATPVDLLRVLLRRHHRGQVLPRLLDERFIELLRRKDQFVAWPLEQIVPDADLFLVFLQERWPRFLDRASGHGATAVALQIPGPLDIPFEHDDIRVYIDSLFLEGMLKPISYPRAVSIAGHWAQVGIRTDPATDRLRVLSGLLDALDPLLPGEQARHQDWLHFATRWAELTAIILDLGSAVPAPTMTEFLDLRSRVDEAFARWLLVRYPGLANQPPDPPVMLHHLPRMLVRRLADSNEAKFALLVIDGLSLDQWVVVRDVLAATGPKMRVREHALFAWVPTLTAVSRQSAFAGKLPLFFPATINTTNMESRHWAQFWADQGLSPSEVVYAKGLGDASLEDLRVELSRPEVRVAGLVVDKVDRILHGMELGAAGMHNQVRQWVGQGYLSGLLEMLFAAGFTVFLTSDHGNTEATGCGRPGEGSCAEIKGERVRVYASEQLRAATLAKFPGAVAWPPAGLPSDYLPLIAPARHAFVNREVRLVAHGGASLEEVVIPLVEMECREA
jgi:hypothetical protein